MKERLALMALGAILLSVNTLPANSEVKHGRLAASYRAGARLRNIREFKTAFQNDQGKVRLIALASPT